MLPNVVFLLPISKQANKQQKKEKEEEEAGPIWNPEATH